jgi:hypothetical protein
MGFGLMSCARKGADICLSMESHNSWWHVVLMHVFVVKAGIVNLAKVRARQQGASALAGSAQGARRPKIPARCQ